MIYIDSAPSMRMNLHLAPFMPKSDCFLKYFKVDVSEVMFPFQNKTKEKDRRQKAKKEAVVISRNIFRSSSTSSP